MKRYSAYPEYKPSGIDWLGDIPKHWKIAKLKFLISSCGGGTPDTSNPEYWEGEIPWVSAKDMKIDKINDTEDHITELGLKESSARMIPPNQVLLVTRSGILKHTIPVAINQVPVAINQDMKALTPKPFLLAEYLFYLIKGNQQALLALWRKQGCTVESIEYEYFANTEISIPSLPEQQAIAAYLDRETAKIDGVIGKREKLIELLQEKRSALISHAVTKGLDPEVKLKPSGIDWLGDIPKHWEMWKLTHVLSFLADGTHFSPPSSQFGEYLYITAKNIKESGVDLSDVTYVSASDHAEIYKRCPVRYGDVLYIKDGATAGVATVNNLQEEFSLLSSVAVMRPRTNILQSRYLAYLLNINALKSFLLKNLVGGAMTRFTIEILKNFEILIPSLSEQQAITDYLDKETAKIDSLIEKEQSIIGKLKEYRLALISETVSGKIDVREDAKHDTCL